MEGMSWNAKIFGDLLNRMVARLYTSFEVLSSLNLYKQQAIIVILKKSKD